MANRHPFAPGEWYHCFSRGVEKRKVFLNKSDYERFLIYLHVANGKSSVHVSNITKRAKGLSELLTKSFQDEPLVKIGAFCLMPNHFHIMLSENVDGGISLFMQKVLTGYTMYFNKRYERSGSLFGNTFKSRHVNDDRYLKRVISYIHLNPAGLAENDWKIGKGDLDKIESYITNYEYSSLGTFLGKSSILNSFVSSDILEMFETRTSAKSMLEEAQEYNEEQNIKV